ncbi:hypothetical protein T484DRAFT_1935498 [Baffinella frigidus]|nr:hypothetical protein T484DRAFT_1935498 [Cryptophyta sp. CCMP2293]
MTDRAKAAEEASVDEALLKAREQVPHVLKRLRDANQAIREWVRQGGTQVAQNQVTGEVTVHDRGEISADPALHLPRAAENVRQLNDQYFAEVFVRQGRNGENLGPGGERAHSRHAPPSTASSHVTFNRRQLDVLQPAVRRATFLAHSVERAQRFGRVLVNRFEHDQEELRTIHLAVERNLPGAKALSAQHHGRKADLEAVTRGMLVAATVLRDMRIVRQSLLLHRIATMMRSHAAKKLQKCARHWIEEKDRVRKRPGGSVWATRVIQRATRAVFVVVRVRKRERAAHLILKVLRNAEKASEVLPAMMLYKRRMLLIQKMARRFIMRLRRAYEFNFNLWDKVEAREIQRLLKARQLRRARTNAQTLAARHFSVGKDVVAERALSSEVREHAVNGDQNRRKRRYMQQVALFDMLMIQYQSNIERRQLVFETLSEFTGIESGSEIRKLTSRLAGDTMIWLKIERPEPVVYMDKSTEAETRELWYENAREHAGPELAMLLDPADKPDESKPVVGAERTESREDGPVSRQGSQAENRSASGVSMNPKLRRGVYRREPSASDEASEAGGGESVRSLVRGETRATSRESFASAGARA